MLTIEMAETFVRDWIDAFNAHDLPRILSHYADDLEFSSPFIPLLKFNDTGVIRSKTDLETYFAIGLNAYPELHFRLHNFFTGIDTVVIYYTSVNGRLAAETFRLNAEGKAVQVTCNYTTVPSLYAHEAGGHQ